MTPAVTANGYLPPKKVSPWRNIGSAIFYLLVYLVVQFAVSLLYQFYKLMTFPDTLSYDQRIEMLEEAIYKDGNLLMIVIDVVLFLLIALLFLIRKRGFFEPMGLKKTRISAIPLAIVAGIGMSCALNIVMVMVNAFLPEIMESYGETMDMTYNMQDFLLYALAGVVGAPIIEELFFRHLVTGRLARAIPRWIAIVAVSTVFGLVHEHPVQWIYAGLLGIVMACVYFAYDSLWVSISFHAGFNAVSLISYIDTEKFNETQLALFGLGFMLFEVVFALGGTIALIYLFLNRTHKVFQKEAEPPVQLYTNAPIPGVAPLGTDGYFTVPAAPATATASAAPHEQSIPGVAPLGSDSYFATPAATTADCDTDAASDPTQEDNQ